MVNNKGEIFNLFSILMMKFMHQVEIFGRGMLIIDYIATQKKCNMKDIAMNFNLLPSTATRQVHKLVESKLVNRKIPKKNRRSVVLTLTTSGNKAYMQYLEHRNLFVTKILQDFTDLERKTLVRMLQKIIDNSKYFTQ